MSIGKHFKGRPSHDSRAAQFDALLREHVPALYRSAYRWTGAVDRAEDLVQELLVRLYPRLDELLRLERIRPWALRVMYRLFIDQLRRDRNSPVVFGEEDKATDDEDADPIDPSPGPFELTEQELTQGRILDAWAVLGEEHRVVLSMHDIEDFSLPEVAQILEIPIGTLKSRLHRARARLRELLAAERFSFSDRV
jgi:RNA polymerase sigma factor (sigma-70 family)